MMSKRQTRHYWLLIFLMNVVLASSYRTTTIGELLFWGLLIVVFSRWIVLKLVPKDDE
jgi:hypothetical protein